MIIRFVRMHFKPDFVGEFLRLYRESESHIRNMDGCLGLRLLRDAADESVFFTLSEWRDEQSLDLYRRSDFFRNLWPAVKAGFAAPTIAHSTVEEFTPSG